MKKPQIINIIVTLNGIIDSIDSLIIQSNFTKLERQAVVEKAEKLFVEKIKLDDDTITAEDIEFFIEEGQYDLQTGYEVSITWSTSVQ